ncbi:endonuclease domain-containing protein [Microbacterium sp. CJ88]|uniref:endonuclease domain-containing protein n=1 Tax=Microbacterium sp. CJ88 TaxID=3445672 RepID=UPI003F655873
MRDRTAAIAAALKAVRGQGGVVRRQDLVRAGHSKHLLADLVAQRRLATVRRVWVALPDADALAVTAARAGVVITCVTQAKRLGLWVLGGEELHVAAPPHAQRPRLHTDAVLHWRAPLITRAPGALGDGIENVLVQVAHCQPREAALAVWESALNKRLVDRAVLGRLTLTAHARSLLDECTPFSDSGLETIVVPRLRWMKLRIVPQAWLEGHRVDFLIGDRLVLQIDGATHVGRQRESDVRHDAQLMLRGYHVIRVGYAQVLDDWPGVQQQIMTAVAQGLHRAR